MSSTVKGIAFGAIAVMLVGIAAWLAVAYMENGIKMTGMPAFGPHHGAEEILAITAFVVQLPGLSADDYRAMTEAAGSRGEGGQGDAAATADPQEPKDEPATEPN